MKADGCDLISGLSESTRGVWTGDVDFNDGVLAKQYQKYNDRLHAIKNLQLTNANLCHDLENEYQELKQNLEFLRKGKDQIWNTIKLISIQSIL